MGKIFLNGKVTYIKEGVPDVNIPIKVGGESLEELYLVAGEFAKDYQARHSIQCKETKLEIGDVNGLFETIVDKVENI